MATIKSFKQKLERLNVADEAGKAIATTTTELVDFNRQQMMEGKRRDGNDISPSYLEDPWFKSLKQAQAYSNWKDRITPNPERKKGVPNLFIVGTYHNTIEAFMRDKKIVFHSTFDGAADIEKTFGDEIYGLNAEKRVEYIKEFLRPEFIKNIKISLQL